LRHTTDEYGREARPRRDAYSHRREEVRACNLRHSVRPLRRRILPPNRRTARLMSGARVNKADAVEEVGKEVLKRDDETRAQFKQNFFVCDDREWRHQGSKRETTT
jgi:hypothetical protein